MKVIGVKNSHLSPTFRPSVKLDYDKATQVLRVELDIITGAAAMEPGSFKATTEVNLKDLRNRADWAAHQTYFVAVRTIRPTDRDSGYDFGMAPLFPLYVETLALREGAHDYAWRVNVNLLVGINIPFTDATDEDLFITVNVPLDASEDHLVVTGDLEKEWSEYSTSGNERTMRFPTIATSAPATIAAGEMAQIDVRIEDSAGNLHERDMDVYVEPVYGTVSGARLKITQGVGTLNVGTVGLNPGDIVRVKLGWKYFPGAEDVIIKVV